MPAVSKFSIVTRARTENKAVYIYAAVGPSRVRLQAGRKGALGDAVLCMAGFPGYPFTMRHIHLGRN